MKTATYSFMYLHVDVVICFFTSHKRYNQHLGLDRTIKQSKPRILRQDNNE